MIFVTDAFGKATYLCHEWRALTGQRLEDAVDDGWSLVVHPEDIAFVRRMAAEAIARQSEFCVCYRLLSPDGTATWVAAGAVPSFGPPDRTFLGFLGSIIPLATPPAEGAIASGCLGHFSPPAPEPHSAMDLVADHLILAHALLVQGGGPCVRAAVEGALHEVGRELARVAEAEGAELILH